VRVTRKRNDNLAARGVLERDLANVLGFDVVFDEFGNREKNIKGGPSPYGVVVAALKLRAECEQRQFAYVAGGKLRRHLPHKLREAVAHGRAVSLKVGAFLRIDEAASLHALELAHA